MPEGNLLLFPELATLASQTAAPSASPPDAAARAAALDIRRSFVVEAPAGSGKTGLLIQRYLKLLADESVSTPEQVVGITFTNKAAGELRDRVLGHLQAARATTAVKDDFGRVTRDLANAVLERDSVLAWQLLEQPHRLNLRTVDSISAEIARSLPVLSGSGGALNPTENANPLFREAARRTLLLLGATGVEADPELDSALRHLLLHRDANLGDCETLIAEMLDVRDQWAALVPLDRASLTDEVLDREVFPRLQLALEQAICADLTTLSKQIPSDFLHELAELAEEMSWSDGYKGNPSPIAICQGRRGAPGTGAEDTEHWRALIHLLKTAGKEWRKGFNKNHVYFEIEKHHVAQLKALIDSVSHRKDLMDVLCRIDALPPSKYPSGQWAVAKSLFRVLRRALIELQFVFAERGQCDFTELSLLARTALRSGTGPHDLTSARGATLQHLLVDEMQDTSSGQYELIQLLTESWDGHTQTVFLVGDPRQSIYLFRQARVERFLATLRTCRIGELPLTALRLTANFRSQRVLVDQFNDDFDRIFNHSAAQTNASGSLPYTNADAILPAAANACGREWHADAVAISKPADDSDGSSAGPNNAQLRRLQARRNAAAIRRIIGRWTDKPLPATSKLSPSGQPEPWRLAVLVRNRSHLVEVVAALRAGGIPFRAVEIEPLNERQEILDLTALTRALLHPGDRVAALALLRAPWCGLSLADLHTLTGSDDPEFSKRSILRLVEERGELLSADACLRMRRLWTALQAAASQQGRLTTAQLVERTWRSLGGDAPLTPDQLINARRYFELLDEIDANASSTLDLALLDRRMQRLYAEPQPIPQGAVTLELLTMHRAKGLEWDVVFIPGLERSPGRSRSRLLTWAELDPSGDAASIMLAPIAARGEEVDKLTAWLKGIYREHETAERKRLFYVAATRAREELHLFASPDLTPQGDFRKSWDSLLTSAWPAAEPHFALATEQAEPEIAAALREASVLDLAAAASVHEMPLPSSPAVPNNCDAPTSATESTQGDLYAPPARPAMQRLPASFDPGARFASAAAERLQYGAQGASHGAEDTATPLSLARPQGSFAARAVGNTVHAVLELVAIRLARGAGAAELLVESGRWRPRVAALLRSNGLPPMEVDRFARETLGALDRVLRDPDGLWVLSAHANAASELAITAQELADSASLRSIRVDRTFHAGHEPRVPGNGCLWIVDYKTASHGLRGVEEFLASERATYAPQLESYARILAQTQQKPLSEIRLALYFPALPRLVWWQP